MLRNPIALWFFRVGVGGGITCPPLLHPRLSTVKVINTKISCAGSYSKFTSSQKGTSSHYNLCYQRSAVSIFSLFFQFKRL